MELDVLAMAIKVDFPSLMEEDLVWCHGASEGEWQRETLKARERGTHSKKKQGIRPHSKVERH